MGSVFPVALPNSSRNPTGSEQPGVYHQPEGSKFHWAILNIFGCIRSFGVRVHVNGQKPGCDNLLMGPWVAKQLDFYQKVHTGVMIPPIWSFFKPRFFFVSHDSVLCPMLLLHPLVFVGLINSSSSFSLVNGNVYCFSMLVLPIFPLKALSFEQPSHRHLPWR